MTNLSNFNDIHFDVLKEIGNIGAGNSATALSMMLGTSIGMDVPRVRTVSFDQAVEELGGPERVCLGTLITLKGDISGMIMFIMEHRFTYKILNILMGREFESFEELGEMDFSAICEIGNIMAAAYVNALATMTGLMIDISPPSLTVDMLGSIMSVPTIEFGKVGDQLLYIEEVFDNHNEKVKSSIILIPEMDSLTKMMGCLGIEI